MPNAYTSMDGASREAPLILSGDIHATVPFSPVCVVAAPPPVASLMTANPKSAIFALKRSSTKMLTWSPT
jgi:hypothetical protein